MPHDAESSTIPALPAANPAEPLTPTALTGDALARLLSAAGGKAVTIDMIQAAVDAGAPVGVGGRINLVEFMAWLERELAQT
ncbi:MAG: hypothetical protein ACE15C_14795 [Phycisphaerae bacterium]